MRKPHYLTYQGRTQKMTEWAREVGLTADALRSRLRKGWSVHKALTTSKTQAAVRSPAMKIIREVRPGSFAELPERTWMTGL